MARDLEPSSWVRTLLFAQLMLWAVGVLTFEALASAGLVGTVAAVLASVFQTTASSRPAALALLKKGWPVVAFIAWGLLASTLAGRPPSGTGVARLLDWAAIPAAAVAFSQLSESQKRTLALTTGSVFLISCAVAACQHYGVWPPLAFFDAWSWTRIPFSRVYEPVPQAEGRFMAGGLLFHRLKFAHTGGLVVLFAAALSIRSFTQRTNGRERVFAGGVVVLGTLSIWMFPMARAASAALVLALAFLGAVVAPKLGKAQIRLLLAVAVAGAAAIAGVLWQNPPLRERFLSSATASGSGDREKLVAAGVRAVQAHPLVGVGAGQFRPAKFPAPDMPAYVFENTGKAHNQFLSQAAELGIPGALLFIVLLGWLVRQMAAPSPVAAAGQACLAYFALLSMTHDPLYQAPFSMGLALALGAGWAAALPKFRRAPQIHPMSIH